MDTEKGAVLIGLLLYFIAIWLVVFTVNLVQLENELDTIIIDDGGFTALFNENTSQYQEDLKENSGFLIIAPVAFMNTFTYMFGFRIGLS